MKLPAQHPRETFAAAYNLVASRHGMEVIVL